MKIKCPSCGNVLDVNITGRKKADIDVTIICDAIRSTKTYRAAAVYVNKKCDMNISGALVHKIITQESDRQGITREELIENIRSTVVN